MNNAKTYRKTSEWERLSNKTGDTKGTFHTRMDGNDKDLIEMEEIKKRWQEYTEELYKTGLMIQITRMVWSLT